MKLKHETNYTKESKKTIKRTREKNKIKNKLEVENNSLIGELN
jgi:hypothetical protein